MLEDRNYWKNRPEQDSRRDWNAGGSSWIDDYVHSVQHEHRNLLVKVLRTTGKFKTLLEVGCNTGPNLVRILKEFPDLKPENLAGIDVSELAIERAKQENPAMRFKVGDAVKIPFADKEFDVAMTDAVLMYVSKDEIDKAIRELIRVARKAIVLVEWFDDDAEGVVKDYHWCRDYEKLLKEFGWRTTKRKITARQWPNERWVQHGYVFTSAPR